MDNIYKSDIETLKQNISDTIADLELEKKRSRIGELETISMEEDFWKDNLKARDVLSEIEMLREEVAIAEHLSDSINTLEELFEISSEDERISLIEDYNKIKEEFSTFTLYKYLSGKYDKGGAILSIHAGQGGTEADDWAEMLFRMYKRYADKKGWSVNVLNIVPGTETGYSSITMEISGKYVFGYLRKESGVHRLVRLSPFNAQNLRQTSFAGVEVIPIIEEDDKDIDIPSTDIEFKAVRASGPGGQHVNKTSSAVQITHIPTGITVQCSERRDQSQNRESAMRMLKAKLWRIREEEKEKEIQGIKGEYKIAGWGNQIRNYVLHPYKLVKDLRTGVETSNPESVLDGELDLFVEAQLRI